MFLTGYAFVIILWLCTNRYDENQLVAFVIRSKGLQFITTGLLSGVYAFAKLYLCVTTGDTMENNSCAAGKNPGGHSSFLFEVILIVVRLFSSYAWRLHFSDNK